jgi:Zn-dependent protease
MLTSWKIGRVFGIPLYVHSTFVLLPILAFFESSDHTLFGTLFLMVLLSAVFTCVLLHELGHALMARRYGIRTRDITLYPIGGVARLERLTPNPNEELLIAVAGPAVNVAILLLLMPLLFLGAWLPALPTAGVLGLSFVRSLFIANLALVLFNMLPAFPMDGGRVLRAFLTRFLGSLRATEIAVYLGVGMATLFGFLAVVSFNPMLFAVAMVVLVAGQQELAAVRRREAARLEQAAQPRRRLLDADEDRFGGFRPRLEEIPWPPMAPASRGGFTGLIWDRDAEVWVRWRDGRPVTVYDGNV